MALTSETLPLIEEKTMGVQSYKEFRKKVKDLQKEYFAEGKKAFGEEAKSLFEKHPKLISFWFTAYTDYFNDGEPCNYHAHTDTPSVNGIRYEYDDWDEETTGMTEVEWKAAVKDIKSLLGVFDNDTYEHLFGDHCRVTVTKKGATVEEYTNHN